MSRFLSLSKYDVIPKIVFLDNSHALYNYSWNSKYLESTGKIARFMLKYVWGFI